MKSDMIVLYIASIRASVKCLRNVYLSECKRSWEFCIVYAKKISLAQTQYLLSTINDRILRFNTKISGKKGDAKAEPDDGIGSVNREVVEVVNRWVLELIVCVLAEVVVMVVVGRVKSARRMASAIASIVASGP